MSPNNQRLFHVTETSIWQKAIKAGVYAPPSFEIDRFIHCCTRNQLHGVLLRYFSEINNLIILELDTPALILLIRFENLEGGLELFPHLYSDLSINHVKKVFNISRKEGQEFNLSQI